MLPTIVIAAVAAVAILLIAVGIASGSGGTGVSARLERYASGRQETKKADTANASLSDLISQSAAISQLNKVVEQRDFGANLSRELARADLKLKVSEYLFIWVAAIVGVPVIMFLVGFALPALQNPILLLVGAIIGFFLPRWYVKRRQGKRLNQFNKQLPDTITLIANALRAGSSFLQAIELVVREARPPISTEFARVIREVNLGLPFEQALENLVRRVRSDDLELMVTAISIQYQVGGNLAEILDSIAYTIRERVRIKGEIRTLTAQQRMSGYVVAFLPIGLAGFLFIIAPGFLEPMFDAEVAFLGIPVGVILIGMGGDHDVHRLHHHPAHRRHRGLGHGIRDPPHRRRRRGPRDPLHRDRPGRLLQRRPGPGPADPARLHAGQEPGGAGAPGSRSSSGRSARWPAASPARSPGSPRRPSRRGPRRAWRWPATRATCGCADWLGIKAICAIVFAILFFLVFFFLLNIGIRAGHRPRRGRPRGRLHRPRVLARAGGSRRARRRSSCRSRTPSTS